jgi:energy-coupling factor transporter ATP-binding protein EcfA2
MNEQTAPLSSRTRLPGEPYPGLRPFLDFESALLFGRERQVREVIAHLRQTQFVAVLGGSGSGKSSLIHAGVVPELRSFGIAGAGDLWLPMTCTPGTNVGREDGASRRHSPVTRLARRFAGLLRSLGDPLADAQRVVEIAEVFRQEAGFARLIDAYGSELAVAPGPDPAQARVLFVLDQFEEIFHPTNRGVSDASLLVERVLDHFFNPHPRCHVVVTMRSEHLNDCASYLELPDAINKSSYLIRRLDERELHDAIVGPAQRFLRLVARTRQTDAAVANTVALPREVVFEPAVLERLLRDVKAITHDPDHLPLLQHLLARLWEAAVRREHVGLPVPRQIQWADLVWAVTAAAPNAALDDSTNALRASVQNWPEREYQLLAPPQRKLLDTLLCRLAFKDPNTGLYSQQRVQVQDGALLLGEGKTPEDLRALIAQGFLGSVDYMFWDDEDPSRVTLKVSHESFIRGWLRFRQLIDVESERFAQYASLLRKCAVWEDNQKSDIFLIDEGDLALLDNTELSKRLANPKTRETWSRLLLVDREGARLSKFEPRLDGFIHASQQRLAARDARLKWRLRGVAILGGLTVLAMAVSAAYLTLIEMPVTQRAMAWLEANRLTDLAQAPAIKTDAAAASKSLALSLRAAEFVDDAYTGRDTVTPRLSQGLLQHLAWLPPVSNLSRFLAGLNAQIESSVNKKLREVLTKGVWPDPLGFMPPAPAAPAQMSQTTCFAAADAAGADLSDKSAQAKKNALTGRLFVASDVSAVNTSVAGGLLRAVFIHAVTADGEAWSALRSAVVSADGRRCRYGAEVSRGRVSQQPRLQFDAKLETFLATAEPMDRVLLNRFDWQGLQTQPDSPLQFQTVAVIDTPGLVANIKAELRRNTEFGLLALPARAGLDIVAAGRALRSVWSYAAPLQSVGEAASFVPLQPAPPSSACAQMSQAWGLNAKALPQVFETAGHCFLIGSLDADIETLPLGPRSVWVYAKPPASELANALDRPPVPLATLSPFAAFDAAATRSKSAWMVAEQGEFAGWLALRHVNDLGQASWLASPWSTCALWRLGQPLLAPNTLAAPAAAARTGVCEGR